MTNSPKFVTYPTPAEEEPLRLKLEITEGRRVTLKVVDENGDWWPKGNLLILTADGLGLPTGVNPDFGIALDEEGRLKLSHDL